MALTKQDKLRLDCFLTKIKKDADGFLGYPSAKDFDFSIFNDYLRFPFNNIGDPFIDGSYKVSSKEFEREVLEEMATLLRAPEDDWWGYITNGGTEGNLYSLYLARELNPNAIVYFSQASHYSVTKNLHFLNMRHIMIRAQDNGEMDYDDLAETLGIHRDVPATIFANIGTTMTEAKDDITKIQSILDGFTIVNRYIHCDAALSGTIAPFLTPRPAFDFADGADSIAISGHKFIGSPIPCGIVLAKKHAVDRIAQSIAYIGTLDTTVSGSRNGLTPLYLWYALRHLGTKGMRARVDKSLAVAAYATDQLNDIGIAAWRNENAITVVFPFPGPVLQDKWQLATDGNQSHIVTMPGIEKSDIDRFVQDMKANLEDQCAS